MELKFLNYRLSQKFILATAIYYLMISRTKTASVIGSELKEKIEIGQTTS